MFSKNQLGQIVAKLLRSGNHSKIRKTLSNLHEADIARIMLNLMPAEQRELLKLLFEFKIAGKTLIRLPKYIARELLEMLEDKELQVILSRLNEKESRILLRFIPEDRAHSLIASVERGKSSQLTELFLLPEDSAADMMTTDYLALSEDIQVRDALEYPRTMKGEVAVFYLYVTDEKQRLIGVVQIHELLLVEPDKKLSDIMQRDVIRLPLESSKEEVADVITQYNLLSVPIVDDVGLLRGVVTIDNVIEVLQDGTTEEMYKFAGLDVEDRVFVKPMQSVKKRLPWMWINVCTALIGALVVSIFKDTINQMVALAFFMPVIAGLSGNTGAQTLTVIVRGLALGEVQLTSARRVIFKELIVGLTNGLVVGIIVAVVAAVWQGPIFLGVIVAMAMIFNFVVAAMIGSVVPMTLKYLGFDPAIASNIFVTATTDIVGFFTYLGLASLFMTYLIS